MIAIAKSSNIDIMLRLRGQRQFKREVDKAARDLEAMGVRGAGALGAFAKQSQNLKDFGRNMTTKVTLPIVAMGALSIKAASDWESAFAGVRKTVDATEGEFGQLERGIRDMALQIPVSAGEIAGIAEAAGQLGIETKNILGFTRVMADLGVATNMTSGDAATQLARFANITRMSQEDFDRLGSTIVDLGNNFATTESEIVNMGQRLAGMASIAGFSDAEIMGLAAAMSSVGIEAEAGGTAMSQSLQAMNSAVLSGGQDLKDFADVAGMSGQEFQTLFKQNAPAALVAFTEGLGRIKGEGGDAGQTLKDLGLGGARITRMFLAMAGNTDLLNDALGTSRDAWKENVALPNEAAQRYKTFESQLQIMKNVIKEVGIAFGENLLPHLTRFVEWIGPKISGALKWFGSLPGTVQAVAVGFVGLLAAVGPASWALGMVAGGVGKLLIIGPRLIKIMQAFAWITKIWTMALLTNPIVLIVVGIVALIAGLVLAYHKVGWFRNAVDAAFAWIKQAAVNAANWVKGAAKWIAQAFQNVKKWITNAVGNAIGFIKKRWPLLVGIMLGPIGVVTAFVITHFGRIKSAAGAVVRFVKDKFNAVVSFFRGLPGRIGSAAKGMFNGIKDAFREAINFIIRAWNSLEFTIPSKKIFGKTIGGGTLSVPKIPEIPGAAEGGNVTQSGSVLIGERGPEILSLPKPARVTPLDHPSVQSFTQADRPIIHTHVFLNRKEIALAVSDEFADARAAA